MASVATALVLGLLLGSEPVAAAAAPDTNKSPSNTSAKPGAPGPKPAAVATKPSPPAKRDGPQPPQGSGKPAPAVPRRDGQQPATKHDNQAIGSARSGRSRCLSQGETRETVATRKLSAPFSALRTAGTHARGETIGVRLCRHNEDLFYEVNVLRRDGRVVKVIIDAVNGRIIRSINDR